MAEETSRLAYKMRLHRTTEACEEVVPAVGCKEAILLWHQLPVFTSWTWTPLLPSKEV
uniref:Uncharacterized protein n=1 Tax=Anguilla anguilla TaxID=7936 RepID=A0A0E9UR20_ANGAN